MDAPPLDFVSPLPPVQTGIADYSVDLLPHLSRWADVRVVRLPGQPIAPDVERRFAPQAASRIGEAGRVPLYQMGNNVHHEGVSQLALAHPGLLTLHDVWLHHLLVERTLARGQLAPYADALEQDHGWLGRVAALPPRWGGYGQAVLFALPTHRNLLLAQRGVLVHSAWAAQVLAEGLGAEWAAERLAVVPMPMPLPAAPPPEAVADFRRRHRLPERALLLGSFGFQTPIKRTEVVLRALARPELGEIGRRLVFLIAGEVSPGLDFERTAHELGIAERVCVSGFLSPTDFPAAIAACDLCVNLRHPTAGETSASLLRVLAHGRGTLVSDYGQFAELPDDAVVKVPLVADPNGGSTGDGDEYEAASLASLLAVMLSNRERREDLGRAARRLVAREHDPERAAREIAAACARLQSLPAGAVATTPADPPAASSLTWGALGGGLEVEGLAGWREGERRELTVALHNLGPARLLAGESGDGGIALEVQLVAGDEDLLAGERWPALPHDLDPGEVHHFRLRLRRPPGPARLRIEPHVLGRAGFSRLGGGVWEREV